jgi:hypothetical protein
MSEITRQLDQPILVRRLHLMSKEVEDAANEFLVKIAELERLLPEIDE